MIGPLYFLTHPPPYDDNDTTIYRLNQRHHLTTDPLKPKTKTARVLDIVAQHGRWS